MVITFTDFRYIAILRRSVRSIGNSEGSYLSFGRLVHLENCIEIQQFESNSEGSCFTLQYICMLECFQVILP